MNPNEIILRPPAGVTVNQWKDGSLHFRCGMRSYAPLAELLEQLTTQCRVYAQAYHSAIESQKQSTPNPPGVEARIAEMQAEIARLRNAGVPVSVDTNQAFSPAQQLAAIVQPEQVPVVQHAPTLFEVDAAMRSRGVQHPAAAAMAVAVPSPPIPPANVPHMQPPPPYIPEISTAHQNPGPSLAGPMLLPGVPALAEPNGAAPAPAPPAAPLRHAPILAAARAMAGTALSEAPHTIVSGGLEHDDGLLGPPPAGL